MSTVQGISRDAFRMFCLDDQIEDDNQVRAIDAIVDTLNPSELGYTEKERKSNAGRPQYDIKVMTKMYLLGYTLGIRSGRKLEKACKYDLRFQWLIEGQKPDANTINDFRKNNREYLEKMFYEVNRLYIMMGILKIENLSQDGYKVKASNSKERNYTLTKLVDRIKREKDQIKLSKEKIKELKERQEQSMKYLTELEKNEELEDLNQKIEEKKRELKEIKERKERHEELVQRMKNEKISQISLTDPDSKLMKNNGVFEVCYNNQGVVDMDTHLTVAIKTDDNPADIGSLGETASIIKREYGEGSIITNTTDKGYISSVDMMESLEKGVIPQVTPRDKDDETVNLETEYEEAKITEEERKSKNGKDIKKCLRSGVIPECYEGIITEIKIEEKMVEEENKEEIIETRSSEEIREIAIENQTFERDMNYNIVYCPAGEVLAQKSTNKGKIRYANKLGCKNCKNPCTCAKYKTVDFRPEQKTICPKGSEASAPRKKKRKKATTVVKIKLKLDKELLSKRMQTSEHTQGTMKTVDNHRYFHMRGRENVSTEMHLYLTASNIRRVCNIKGTQNIIKMVKEVTA